MQERRRRTRDSEASWPAPQPGHEVVLHTRVVTDTGGGPDKTIMLGAAWMNAGSGRVAGEARFSVDCEPRLNGSAVNRDASAYWVAAAYMHPPRDPGFAAIRRRAAEAGCPLIGVPDRGPLDRGVIRRLLAVCRRYRVHIWHGHDYKSNMLGLLLRPFWDMKLVTTAHGWVTQTARTPLYYAVDRWCLPRYHHVICVSSDLYAQALRLGVAPERCTLIPNGIDEQTFCRRFAASEAPLRARYRVPAGRLVVGAAGRLRPEKAFNNLIHAVHGLIGLGLDLELWIAGAGAAQAQLQALVERLGLGERVRLLGFVEDTIDFYHGLDLFVLSSLREGLPNVVLEAMAMRVPVVATRVAGVPALIEDGRNGLLCPPGDIAGLAAAIRRAVEDPVLRAALAGAGRESIERHCTFTQRMERERRVYDEVLAVGAERDSSRTPGRG